MFLKEGTREYHIIYNGHEHFCTHTYKSVTSNDFMEDVYEYLLDQFGSKLIKDGTDVSYDEDVMEQYIWIHLAEESAEKEIENISASLEQQFENHWRLQRVPTLLTLVKQQLNRNKVLAYAISDFQERRGVVETQTALDVFSMTFYNIFICGITLLLFNYQIQYRK